MTINNVIVTISILIWLLPPIRQFRGGYFFFFLILAISDPLNLIITEFSNIHPLYLHLIISVLLVFSLYNFQFFKKNWIIALIITAFLSIIFFFSLQVIIITMAIIHLILIAIFLNRATIYLQNFQIINLFFLILILYEASIISKVMVLLFNFSIGRIYYDLTSFFQILVGLYFTFLTLESSPKISFKS